MYLGAIIVEIACLDLEGVLIPEVWIAFSESTGIQELRATTRDIPDYDVLMQQRLKILNQNKLTIYDIQKVIGRMEPLPGAISFLEWLQERFQVIILSDTFYEFSEPFMRKLSWPTLFCHSLITDSIGNVIDYKLRQPDPKRKSVKALHSLKYRVIAAGDSYNDITMLKEADVGILFHAPENVIKEFPQFVSVQDFDLLRKSFIASSNRSIRL